MNESKALTPVAEADYDIIESAVMETARGRWFLAEYARRNRTADTQVLLEAIGRLEQSVVRDREVQDVDRLRFDLIEMAKAITRTKTEISSIAPSEGSETDLTVASEALDAIVRTTERATSDILEAAENVQEAAWTLREEGASAAMCDELDRRATEIYTACSFQDLTAQRTSRIVETLRYLEGRINAMIEIWGGADEDAEVRERSDLSRRLDDFDGLGQDAVDDVLVDEAEPRLRVVPEQPRPPLEEPVEEIAFEEAVADVAEAPVAASPAEAELEGAMEPELEADALGTAGFDDLALTDAERAELAGDAAADDAFNVDTDEEAIEDAPFLVADPGPSSSGDALAFTVIDDLDPREKLRRFT
jgi:chemotaxis regulatin CheY-phosphate phosphatase CheZ